MNKNRLAAIALAIGASLLTLALSLLLMKSTKLAIGAYGFGVGLTMLFVEPFIGLVNYLLFVYLRPQEFIPGMIGLPVMLLLGAGTAGLMLLHMAVRRTSMGLRRIPHHLLMAWFVVAIVLSHFRQFDPAGGIAALKDFSSILILYTLIAAMTTTVKRVKIVFVLLLVMTLFLAAQGLFQYFTGYGIAHQELFQGRIVSIGIFSDPNDLALALLIVLPMPVLAAILSKNLLARAAYLSMALFIAVVIFMTESRGGILSMGAVLFVLFSRRYGWRMGSVVGVVMAAAIFILGPSRMSTVSTQEASAAARVASWTVGFDLLQSYPVFGVGAFDFTEYHPKTAHNSLILCASELGFFGLFPWMFLFLMSFKNMRFVGRRAGEIGLPRLALYAESVGMGLVAFFLGSMFLSRTYNELLFVLFALSAAITTVYIRESGKRYVFLEKRDFVHNALFVAGSLLFLKAFLFWAW